MITTKLNIENVIEAKLSQAKNRFNSIQEADKKAMDTDIERVLKQSDIVFTINGFVLAIMAVLNDFSTIFKLVLFLIFIGLLASQSFFLRGIRNQISINLKNYFIENSKIIRKNYDKLMNIQITKVDDIDHIVERIQKNQKEIDNELKPYIDESKFLVKKQTYWIYITIINFLIILILIIMKYDFQKLICG